ncbi:hypothetical protein SRABI96_04521 [Peribacillus sp. Bi96]|nr:hypothetical protein SRABI96_04521 [Peribacillus sp. Bi96]
MKKGVDVSPVRLEAMYMPNWFELECYKSLTIH